MTNQERQGGFCKFGDFVWIDLGGKELSVNPQYVARIELAQEEFDETKRWRVMFEIGGYMPSMYSTLHSSEAEARNLVTLLARADLP